MVVCKFFLQGRCKFGDNCKFEHQIDDSTHNHSASVMRQLQQSSGSIDTNTLVRSVQNDMLNAEKGGQWFLSSYAPFKDKPAFPGFEDKSFEEVRFGFYEASKAGTAEQYVQQLQTLIKDAVLKSKALQNPSPETVHLLTQIYNSPYNTPGNFSSFQTFPDMSNSNTPLQGSSNFNSNAIGKSIFSQNNQGMFGQSPMFVKPNMYSGATQSSSIFNAPPQNTPAIFGGGQKSIFGGGSQSYSGGIFGQQNNIPAQNPIFAPQQQNPAQINPFKNQVNNPFLHLGQVGNSPFVKQNDAPLFGVHNQPSNSPLVGNFVAPLLPSSVFNTTSQALPFNTQKETNPHFTFNVQQPPESIRTQEFDGSRQRDSVFPPSPLSLLGGAQEDKQTLGGNIFGSRNPSSLSVVNIDESVYSKVENLNESDVKAFQSEHFEFGEIPEKPPTLQMCF